LRRRNPEAGAFEVHLVAAQAYGLADTRAVAVGHEKQQVVARAVAPGFGGLEQAGDLVRNQEILGALVPIGGVGGVFRATSYLLPFGRGRRHVRHPLLFRVAG